jgi:ribonucleoside-diphosphate reductase alpha chain
MDASANLTENISEKSEGSDGSVENYIFHAVEFKVVKRTGEVALFDPSKIKIAMTKAFLAVEGGNAAESNRVHQIVDLLLDDVLSAFQRRMPNGGTLNIEDIQDQVELALMRRGEHKIARSYVLYREQRRLARENSVVGIKPGQIRVKLSDGTLILLDEGRFSQIIQDACMNLEGVDANNLFNEVKKNLFDGIALADVDRAMVLAARQLIEVERNYTFVAARMLLHSLRSEALSFLGITANATFSEMKALYPMALVSYIQKGIDLERLDPALAKFDLEKLGRALVNDRDNQFDYLGLQTLYDRYFIHEKEVRYELPQVFFMRVAMGLALREKDKNAKAIEFYNVLSTFDYMSSTPTLFNSGTTRSQLSSCFLSTVGDDIFKIGEAIVDNMALSKFAGGLGNDWTPVRAMGAHIKGTNGKSQGVVPFLKVVNDVAVAVNQGGKRKGAVCVYLETWHLDIEEFLDLRKNSGDDRRRTHDMNTANWIPDLFMKRVLEDGQWTLFTPNEVPDLHDLYGEAFEKAYVAYEEKARHGELLSKSVSATKLWRKMLSMLFETGHPWITFKDPCNIRSPQQHCGVVHSSNLCTEITLNTSEDEIAVCNLGSVNLPAHIVDGKLDSKKLKHTIQVAMRMLDNVIDINYYAVPKARKSNLAHRPVGLGIMGFQDALYKLGIDYASDAAVQFADTSMEEVSYYCIEASSQLAEERGTYDSYEGSLWSKGILPIDSIQLLQHTRGKDLDQDTSQTLDWNKLRNRVRTKGMRNSNVMAIAPTATISNICGVSQSIEPTYQNLYVKSNLSGDFTVVNPYLVDELKKLGMWDQVMVNDLKYFNGSVQQIGRIPAALKARFATSFEIDPNWLIHAASRRQKWIDQAQSLNLYMAKPSGKKMGAMYELAWRLGLKTTYYFRSLGASSTEKSTLSRGELNAVKREDDAEMVGDSGPKVCSILDPSCEACQ